MAQRYKSIRGTHDILPEEVPGWHFLERTAREMLGRYGFREMRTPLLEATRLFARSVGESSDIVRKEMYTFGEGDDSVCLRPEATASVARAFVEHSRHRSVAAGFPERYYYIGPMFRRERPQKGRQRQFHQIGVEVLGTDEGFVDAETLQMLDSFLRELGIVEFELVLNSVGDESCRPVFRQRLQDWLRPRLDRLCADCNRRYEENPLRVLDCKVDADQKILADAPSILESLCEPCAEHFGDVRSALERYGVPYRVDPRLVRGLDYYRRTVFEVLSKRLGAQSALLGGGRYDGLIEELGGPAVPGFGFAMGMERTLMLVDPAKLVAPGFDLALVSLGAEGFLGALPLAQRLRAAGVSVLTTTVERPMGAQLKRADKNDARFVVFVGKQELADGRFGVKELKTGEQVSMTEQELLARLKGNQ